MQIVMATKEMQRAFEKALDQVGILHETLEQIIRDPRTPSQIKDIARDALREVNDDDT